MKSRNAVPMAGCVAALLWCESVWATDAFYLIGHGPISIGMGGTAAAHDIGPAAMMANPATLGLMSEGKHFLLGMDVIAADLKVENEATGEVANSHSRGRNNGPYYAPELSFVWRHGPYALGVGAFAQAGVGTQFGSASFLSRTSTNNINTGLDTFSRLIVFQIPFSAAYQATDKLMVGGSLDAVWTSVNLGLLLDTTQIGALAAQRRLSGGLVSSLMSVPQLSAGYLQFNNNKIAGGAAEAWGIGGKLGLTYQVSPATRLGLAYQFKTNVNDLAGRAQLAAVSAVAGNIPLSGTVRVRDFQMPAALTLGISHEFSDRLTVAADYQRVFWRDAMKDAQVRFAQDGSGQTLDLSLPLNYRDINVFSIGTQYRYNASWTLRGGFHYAQEATPSSGILAVLPSTSTTNITAGVSYSFGKSEVIDFALAYAFPKGMTNGSLPNTNVPIRVTHAQVVGAIAFRKQF